MRVCLCTLVLNEMEWLPKLYEQHKDWPGLVKWIFVESADACYKETNPELVSPEGLSVDGTTQFLEKLATNDDRVVHIKHGISYAHDPAQGKCQSRNRYLDEMDSVEPDFFVVVDADEFYPKSTQTVINSEMERKKDFSIALTHREIWFPPSIQNTHYRFGYEVIGGFWSILYCRIWKWFPNLLYVNHNTPFYKGNPLTEKMLRYDSSRKDLYHVHLGFAGNSVLRKAKNRYYENRGESKDPKRSWYCESRACFESWKPGDILPREAQVIPYTGLVPECFYESTS